MTFNLKSSHRNTFLTALCYGIGLYLLQIFLYKCGMLPYFPSRSSLLNWDGIFYYSIATEGYSYNNWVSNTGFCVMFPWVWKLSHLGVYGACLLNTIFFASGFTILCHLLQPTTTEKWLWLSTPSLYFAFIPYPEALFFLFIAVALYGIQHNKKYLIWVALCCSSLTRMNIICLLPTFILAEILNSPKANWVSSAVKAFLNNCLPLIAGLAIFVLYQYYTTGVWFAYFIKQRTIWNRVFAMPKLPFQVASGPATLWINALALFVCFIATICIISKLMAWVRNNKANDNKLFTLACLYLLFSALLTIFFNPTWGGSNTTNVIGAHRYILASPFFFIFLQYFTSKAKGYSILSYVLVFFIANIFWLAFGSYMHIQQLLFFNFNTLILLCYMAIADKKLSWPSIVLISVNILMQVMLMQRFLGNLSID